MFAFLIWDTQERTVVRRPGPLRHQAAVHRPAGRRRRSSSARRRRRCWSCSAAARPPAGWTPRSLQHYLTLQYVPEPATLHRGIRRIESGTSFTVVGRRAAHRRATSTRRSRSAPVAQGRAAGALRPDRRRPRRLGAPSTCAPTSPSGSFLSGGIDSTAIAALAKRYNPNLLTFTAGFEREGFSEIDVAAESAAAIGVEHITKVGDRRGVRRRDPAGRLVPRRPGRRPGARAAVLHRPRGPQARQGGALRRGRRRAVRRLQHLPRAAVAWPRFDQLPARHPPRAGPAVGRLPDGHARQGPAAPRRRSRWRSATTATPASSGTTSWASCCTRDDPTCRTSPSPRSSTSSTRAAGYDDVTAMQYVDLFTWLRGDILVKADKMTMANSLELRVPFLDPEVFEVAGTLPVEPAGDQGDDEVRAAAGAGADRAAARAEPAQARLPGADPALAGRARCTTGPGEIIEASQTDEWLDRQQVLRDAGRAPATGAAAQRSTTPASSGRCWSSWSGTASSSRSGSRPEIPETVYPVRL